MMAGIRIWLPPIQTLLRGLPSSKYTTPDDRPDPMNIRIDSPGENEKTNGNQWSTHYRFLGLDKDMGHLRGDHLPGGSRHSGW